ncbi:ScyD/ScyE family protein [Zunongwangia sp. F363]|uniref:ScyD/ScyE family protein n=1 Tax=Autumnicola tepida TaxID=3075595 RepID=A0ABU3C5T7_9FLAO|nr:ScyD/ScyE family protein [Zunongwangia sp. F363]MDT0641709.1 ScyD/ScyE family protein [Zunongwangia sp. F363]
MKNLSKLLLFLSFDFLFISCSEEENSPIASEKSSISFGAVLNDLLADKAAVKQAVNDLPACSDDDPSYVEIILLQDVVEVLGSPGEPFQIDLVAGETFTQYVPELELDPGTYSLDYFAVYNSAGELIWLAPRGGELEGFVENPLPLTINLGAGVKKYVDVPVLCYDERLVNEYGYLFFDLIPTELVDFCFFANFCKNSGRHFPAAFSLDIWLGTDDTGIQLYSNEENNVSTQGEDPSAEPLCIVLPDLAEFADDEDYIYYEITLLDWAGVYGDADASTLNGTLSREDIQAHFDGDEAVDYEHLMFGCSDGIITQFNGPLFDLITIPYGKILVADASAGIKDLYGNMILDLPGVNSIATVGTGNMWATTGPAEETPLDENQRLYQVLNNRVEKVVNLFEFEAAYNPDGADVNSNPFDVKAINENLALVVDAGGNDLLRVDNLGNIEVVAVFPPEVVSTDNVKNLVGCPGSGADLCELPPMMPAQAVPTTVVIGPDGYYYVGELKGFPAPTGEANIWRIAPNAEGAMCGSSADCT